MTDNTLDDVINKQDEINQSTAAAAAAANPNDVNLRQSIKEEIFRKTGQKIDNDDAITDLVLVIQDRIADSCKTLDTQLRLKHENYLSEFDQRLLDLNEIVKKLEDQKSMIVADVWQKLDKRVADKVNSQVHADLSKMASEIATGANNSVNNQRNMLMGGVGGLLLGLLVAMIFFVFK